MWKTLEERNLAIIETVMQELGVSDIEDLPAKVIELKEAAQHKMQRTVCTRCETQLVERDIYCPTCGLWNPNNRR